MPNSKSFWKIINIGHNAYSNVYKTDEGMVPLYKIESKIPAKSPVGRVVVTVRAFKDYHKNLGECHRSPKQRPWHTADAQGCEYHLQHCHCSLTQTTSLDHLIFILISFGSLAYNFLKLSHASFYLSALNIKEGKILWIIQFHTDPVILQWLVLCQLAIARLIREEGASIERNASIGSGM